MRTETLTESVGKEIDLSAEEEAQLRAIGRRLAKGTDRYGAPLQGEKKASLVSVERTSAEAARVRVPEAVGLISLPSLQLLIEPKIPQAHLFYLIEHSELLPRLDWQQGPLEHNDNLAVLISHWFVKALERVLEEGLSRDYRPISDEIKTVRGRLHLLPTARLFYAGRLAVAAEFEEFDFDTPLNRLLLHAARIVAAGSPLPIELRQRAMRSIRQLDSVSDFRPADMAADVDRMTAHYRDAVPLAKQVIHSSGRGLEVGATKSWTFLVRTADPVEAGIRAVLSAGLEGVSVKKKSLALGGTAMTVNPDLVFGDITAIGDVKYKLDQDEGWGRSDLYEVVAFAAAAKVKQALIVNFRSPASVGLTPVEVGAFRVSERSWCADPSLSATAAASDLAASVDEWLASIQPMAMAHQP